MKKITLLDEFVDFKGIKRPFTACIALVEGENIYAVKDIVNMKDWDVLRVFGSAKIPQVNIGLSICHENDLNLYNTTIGIKQAEGRALTGRNTALNMLVSDTRFFTMDQLAMILENFIDDFKKKPGKYIKGYNEYEEKYLKQKQLS